MERDDDAAAGNDDDETHSLTQPTAPHDNDDDYAVHATCFTAQFV